VESEKGGTLTLCETCTVGDVLTNTVLVRGGEYRIPPGKADTTLIIGLELPSGVQQATVTLHTTAWRGPFVTGSYSMTLSRDHYFHESPTPKQAEQHRAVSFPNDSRLVLFPSIASAAATVTVALPFEGAQTLRIHSVLGVELQRQDMEGARGANHALRLPALPAGLYFLRVTGPEGSRTAQFTVR